MNSTETVRLVQMIKAVFPAMRMDDDTPVVWTALLRDLSLADALEAVKHLGQTKAFISAAEIIQEVKRIRADRLAEVEIPEPNVDPDDVRAWMAEQAALKAAAADGTLTRERAHTYAQGGMTLTGAQPRYARGEIGEPKRRLLALEGVVKSVPA